MEEKTTKELWEDIERKNLEDALNAKPGSEEGKQAFKQATDAHNIREKENQIEDGNKESKRKIAVDILKGVVFGIAAFGGQVILKNLDKNNQRELMRECMDWETGEDAQMFTTTPGKSVKNIFRFK